LVFEDGYNGIFKQSLNITKRVDEISITSETTNHVTDSAQGG